MVQVYEQYAGCFNMGHDQHEIHRLVIGDGGHLQSVCQTPMVITRIRTRRIMVMITFSIPITRSRQSTARISLLYYRM